MSVLTEISVGEFVDKLTILRIKSERIRDPDQLANINHELEVLNRIWQQSAYAGVDIARETRALSEVNEQLWEIEDAIRELESRSDFGRRFIELARAVYITNDRRAELKKQINRLTGSAIMEEKSYHDYRSQ